MALPSGIVTVNVLPSPSMLSTLNRSAVELDQFLHQRQPDAGALVRAAAALFDAVEALEHARQFLGRNAHAGIANGQARLALAGFQSAPQSHPRE